MKEMFPKDLASLKQWICWRMEPNPKGGKDNKIPYNPHNGKKASSTNAQNWATLENALAARDRYLYTGLGFVFTNEAGIVGVDIDHCRNPETGELNEIATAILERISTYTEISPSGTGLHIFVKGKMPENGNKNSRNGVEMYAHSRYFTMTGIRLANTTDEVAEDNGTLAWIHTTYIKPKTKKSSSKKSKKGGKRAALTDEEVLEKARVADNGEQFDALWDGRWTELYASQSEADMALCCKLAFWTGKNREQMDRLFRQSKLMRDKWDIVHHASGATYGAETLDKAIEAITEVYSLNGDAPVFEYNGRYFRAKGDNVYPLTNFVIVPVEMIISEDETQITAELATVKHEVFRQNFMTTDFSNLQKFKNILNKRTIALSYTGSEGDLELLKSYISDLDWVRKTGVKALGLYEHNGCWVYVSTVGAVESDGKAVSDVVQLEKYRSIKSDILSTDPITSKQLKDLGKILLAYNEPAKTVAVLAWCAGCFIKEHLKRIKVKFPHLFLIGEQGSGKSNTLERIVLPIFSRTKVNAATQVTAFTLMKDSASSNLIPQPLDEFKPSKMDRNKLNILYNHMRDSYDGHEGVRGRADQSSVVYELLAPLIVAGEESPEEPAIRERSIELLFSRKDLKPSDCHRAYNRLCTMTNDLSSLGRGLLDVALRTTVADVETWYMEGKAAFDDALPSRIITNLACCFAGLRLVERLCKEYSLSWLQVFDISLDACSRYLTYAAREYLLDGNILNKGIIEQSLEIMARMSLDEQCEWTLMENDTRIAIRFNKVYDRFTKYRRDHAIMGECLPYTQFLKQLRKSELFVEYKPVRFKSGLAKAYVLDYTAILECCDISGFDSTDVVPLT